MDRRVILMMMMIHFLSIQFGLLHLNNIIVETMWSLNFCFLLIVGTDSLATRRAFVGTAFGAASWSSFSAPAISSDIASKLDENILVLPQPTYNSELNGIDNLYYPEFLEGEWEVRQTLVDSSFPLGLKFVGVSFD